MSWPEPSTLRHLSCLELSSSLSPSLSLGVSSDVAVTLDSTFLSKTASSRSDSGSGKGKATRKLVHPSNEDLLKGRRNTRIRILPANDPENQLRTPLQIFCDNDGRELNNNAIIVCEYEGVWHQVLFPKEVAMLAQSKTYIHQLGFITGNPRVGVFNTAPVTRHTAPIIVMGKHRTMCAWVFLRCDDNPLRVEQPRV